MERELLKKGDKVVLHDCKESEGRNCGKIWTCRTDEVITGEGYYNQGIVFLEGFDDSFPTTHLQKVNVKSPAFKLDKIEVDYLKEFLKVTEKNGVYSLLSACENDEFSIVSLRDIILKIVNS